MSKLGKKEIIKGQKNLFGKAAKPEEEPLADEEWIQISALQKYIRRGETEKAMHNAWKLSTKKTGYHLWRRLAIIAVEDVLDPLLILTVSEMSRQSIRFGYESGEARMFAVGATKLLAEAKKDRTAEEFTGLEEFLEKHPDDELCSAKLDEMNKIEDYVLDQHTRQGQRMGRVGINGERFWFEESSKVTNESERYMKYGEWVWKNQERVYYGKKKQKVEDDGKNEE